MFGLRKLWQTWTDDPAKERRLALTDGADWAAFFGRDSKAGKLVTLDSALQLATVWACIRMTAVAISSVPLAVYEKGPNGSRREIDDDLASVIADSPNSAQNSVEFWEMMAGNLTARGNAYAEISRTAGYLSALRPIEAKPDRQDGRLVYRVWDRGKTETLPADKVFHLKGFTLKPDALEGMSPIAVGVQTMGSAIAADETAAKIFANGLQQPLFIDSGQSRLTKDQRKDLTDLFKKFAGSDNAGKVMVLEGGMKPVEFSLNPEDAQMLETRRFNVEEECRWFNMPPLIIGHAAEGQTMWGTGVEHVGLWWQVFGLNPIWRRIEASIRKQLIRPDLRRTQYAEFNREGLLQADSKTKAEFLSNVVQNGLMTRREGRQKLNLPPTGQRGEDLLTAQTNLAPLDQLGASGDPRAALRAWLGIKD